MHRLSYRAGGIIEVALDLVGYVVRVVADVSRELGQVVGDGRKLMVSVR